MSSREAMYWTAVCKQGESSTQTQCLLCPHNCLITEKKSGLCGVRENVGGKLVASGYGIVSSIALDPIEKKPLYMFHPGSNILSIGGFGCNFKCQFCQNHEISMPEQGGRPLVSQNASRGPGSELHPDDIARLAVQHVPDKNIGVAYTYNEPLINYEFLFDCAKLVRAAGLKNILVTNGYINKEPLEKLLPHIDAMNIDVKGFTEQFYNKLCGTLNEVKKTVVAARPFCHVEVTTLVIPGENEDDIEDIAKWLAAIDPNIPLHLSRFFPRYNYKNKDQTPQETVTRLRDKALKHLNNVFCGNM